jgi:hypothetical protein
MNANMLKRKFLPGVQFKKMEILIYRILTMNLEKYILFGLIKKTILNKQ